MKNFLNKYKFGIIAIFVSTIVAILFCLSKRDFHIDESLTFALSNADGGWVKYDTYGWYSKETWLSYMVSKPFNYKQVFQNQYWDVHPPLYYCLIHTFMSFFPKRFTIWFGLLINLVFYILDLIFIYIIVYRFIKNDLLSSLCVLLFGLNKHVLDCVIFIRMYMMSSFFVLLFLFSALRIINKEKNKFVNYAVLFISVICGGLTHYQFYMIIASLSLFIAIYLITKKRWIDLLVSFSIVVIAGLLNVFVIFKGTLYHLTVNGYGTHVGTAISGLENLYIDSERLNFFTSNSWGGYLQLIVSIILLICMLVLTIKNKIQDYELVLVLIASYLLGFTIIMKTSTFYSARYLLPVESIGIIGNFLSIYYLFKDKPDYKKLIIIFIVMIALNIDISTVINNISTKPSWVLAEEHQNDLAIVITDEKTTDDEMNVLFTNLMWYEGTGITQVDKDFPLEERNYIIYIEHSVKETDALDYIKSQLISSKKYTIVKENIVNEDFYIYSLTFD